MKQVASAAVSGPEATGKAAIHKLDNGQYELVLSDFWVAPGAPDVWVAMSPETDGQPNAQTIDLASYKYSETVHRLSLGESFSLEEIKTVIIYCKKFNVHFGHGLLSQEPA